MADTHRVSICHVSGSGTPTHQAAVAAHNIWQEIMMPDTEDFGQRPMAIKAGRPSANIPIVGATAHSSLTFYPEGRFLCAMNLAPVAVRCGASNRYFCKKEFVIALRFATRF
eukprot:6194306-Pleurochrysis_carterae.AAC.3